MAEPAKPSRRIGRIHRDTGAICQRWAVAPRILGERFFRTLALQGDAAILRHLKRRWYARSRRLMEAGWQVPEAKQRYLVHCPPATCDVHGWTNPCRYPRICPFCYMRDYVALSYQRVLAYLEHPVCQYFDPVLATSVIRWTFEGAPQAGATELQLMKERFRLTFRTRQIPARICFGTMEPGEKPGTLTLSVRNLLVLDVADPREYGLQMPGYHQYRGRLTKRLVGKAVRRLTDYPRWLIWGDEVLTAKILAVCESRKLRNIEFYGGVRPRRGLRATEGPLD